jgi:methyl-accepting chemotaxis protein
MSDLRKFKMGLKGKIQLIFILIFAFSSLAYALALYVTIKPILHKQALQDLEKTTFLISSQTDYTLHTLIQNHLQTRADDALKAANFYYNQYRAGDISEKEAYSLFRALLLDPEYGKIGETGYLAGVNGRGILEIHPKSEGVDASSFKFIQDAVKQKNGYLEYEWANKGEDKPRLKAGGMAWFAPWDIIVWASSYKSEFSSMIDPKQIELIVNRITIGTRGYCYIMDSKGVLISHPTLSGQSVYDYEDSQGNKVFQQMIKTAIDKPDTVHTLTYPWRGNDGKTGKLENKLAIFKKLESLDWIVVSTVPVADTTAMIGRVLLLIPFITLLLFILTNVIVKIVFSKVLRPVQNIRELTDAVFQGDLTNRVEVENDDEIGEISRQFNMIISRFETFFIDLKQTTEILNETVQEISVSSQEIATTSNQQAAAVKEIVSTMEDSDQLSKSIAVRIDEVTKVSQNTKSVVDNGFGMIQNSLDKMTEIRESNTETINGIKLLGERIDNIWDIVNIINGIADQTKIIAFNAELEASAAGDAGRNFQIVASEIRRLADSTVASTSEIKNKINEIQRSSDKLILASEEGTEKIRSGLDLSRNLRKLFEDVLSSSEISSGSAEQIALSIRQQVMAFEQILQTLKQISEGIENFTLSTRATSLSSGNLKIQAEKIQEFLKVYTVNEGQTHEQQ